MNHEEVTKVLTAASSVDGRTIGRADVVIWHKIVGGYDFADALDAVVRHFGETRERLMPADLIRQIKAIREERRREQHSDPLALPSRWEDDPDRDERAKAARERLHREVLAPLAAKRDLARALREQETSDAIEAARLRFAAGSEWQMTPNAKTGVWWDDPAARERHCNELLAGSSSGGTT